MIDAENESPAGCGKHPAGQLPIKPDELKTVHRTAAGLFSFYARGPPTVNRLMTKGCATRKWQFASFSFFAHES